MPRWGKAVGHSLCPMCPISSSQGHGGHCPVYADPAFPHWQVIFSYTLVHGWMISRRLWKIARIFVIQCTFRALLSYLPNGKTTLWMCTKTQKGDNQTNLDFPPDFCKNSPGLYPDFYKKSPDEELVTLHSELWARGQEPVSQSLLQKKWVSQGNFWNL